MWYEKTLKPLLFKLDPETAHDMAYMLGKLASSSPAACHFIGKFAHTLVPDDPFMCWGLSFPNRLGLAAGFDKHGYLPAVLQALGFGFVEVGSVTALPSQGNPRPRMFRLPADRALINRMGLNNEGARRIVDRLIQAPAVQIPVGINIAKTHNPQILGAAAIEDYRVSFSQAVRFADYINVNISCPNTEEGKTFEDPEALSRLLTVLMAQPRRRNNRTIPVLVKLSADLDAPQRRELVSLCEEAGIDGYVAVNTSGLRKSLVHSSDADIARAGRGGLSGAPLLQRSLDTISDLHSLTGGRKPIIGVGGIVEPSSAVEMRQAGASLVQVYSGLVYKGPGLVKQLRESLGTIRAESLPTH